MKHHGIITVIIGIVVLLATLTTAAESPEASANGNQSPPTVRSKEVPTVNGCWNFVASPNVGQFDNTLKGVAAVASNDVWAVGFYYANSDGTDIRTLVEHWNGTTWTVVASPNPGTRNSLYAVTVVSPTDVWAVGDYSTGTLPFPTETLVEHWDGTSWSVVPSPTPGNDGGSLVGVASVGANDIWAVGYLGWYNAFYTLIEHWDGSGWSVVPSPNPSTASDNFLQAVSARASNDVWAVGYYSNCGWFYPCNQTLVEHWNGSSWTVVPSPNHNATNNELYAIAAIASNDVWAVGRDLENSPFTMHTLLEHWDGSTWSLVSDATTGAYAWLTGVAALTSGDVWAVGLDDQVGTYGGLTEHWDGQQWSRLPGPRPSGGNQPNLFAVTKVTSEDVWVVGETSSPRQTLIGHYSMSCGTPSPTSTLSPTITRTPPTTPTPMRTPTLAPTRTTGTTITPPATATLATGCPPPFPPIASRLATQVPNQVAQLVDKDDVRISDSELASWMRAALNPGGVSHVKEASFFFQECLGGAMLNHLQYAMGNSVRWMGASASQANQEAHTEAEPPYNSWWTETLLPQLAINQPLVAAAATVPAQEPFPIPLLETAQWISDNGGENIYLADACTTGHHAILWVGYTAGNTPENMSVYQDTVEMWSALRAAWGNGSNNTITVLYGDATHAPDGTSLPSQWQAQPATKNNLQTAIATVGGSTGSNEQFFFYASDHGSETTYVVPTPMPLPAGGQTANPFVLSQAVLDGMSNEPVNGQEVVVDYAGTLDSDSAVVVRVNGLPIGYLLRNTISMGFSVPESLLAPNNEIVLESANSTTITINTILFSAGLLPPIAIAGASPTVTIAPTPCPIQFSDVPPSQPFYSYVRTLVCRGIIAGYGDGTFRPYNNVTRGQVTKFVVNAAGLADPVPTTQQTFTDVPTTHPFWLYIERLAGRGYISGYGCGGPGEPCDPQNRPYFRPGADLTRSQLAKIVANTAEYAEAVSGQLFEDVPSSSPFYPFIERLALHGAINGYNCGATPAGVCVTPGNRPYFVPGGSVTRGQTAKIVANTFYPGTQTP